MNQFYRGLVRQVSIRTALQHTGIAALEAEREHVESHIRTGLVNHANDTKRHRDTMQAQAVGQRLLLGDMAQGRRQFRHVAHVTGYIVKTLVSQLQAVVQWILGVHLGQILLVGGKDALFEVYDSIGYSLQYLVAQVFWYQGQRTAGSFGLLKCFNQFHKV